MLGSSRGGTVLDEYRLTQRQVSVLELVAKGLTNAEIASVLGISAGTVKTHVSAIITALDVTNRTEAAVAFRKHAEPDEPATELPASPVSWPSPVRVCVLPFQDLSASDAGPSPFATGIVEDLIDELTALPGVHVIAHGSSSLFPAGTASLPDVARVLRVHAAITGSIRRFDERVCITARLVAANNTLVWSRRFEQAAAETLSLQRKIASQIASELSIELAGTDAQRQPKGTARDRARELYWEGRVYWHRRDPAGVMKAMSLFRAAIDIDPSYDTVHVGLADALNQIGAYATIRPQDAFNAAKHAALRALEITPNLGAAHASLGYAVLFGDWDVAEAENRLRRGLRLAPGYSIAHGWLSLLYLVQQRYEEALAEIRKARDIDPLSIPYIVHEGRIRYSAGERTTAIELFGRAIDMDDRTARATAWLALAHALDGDHPLALPASERAVEITGRHPLMLANLGCVHGFAGRRDEAMALRDELVALQRRVYVSPFYFGLIYAGCGDVDDALRELARAYEERAPLMLHLGSEPAFTRLHGHPGFEQLVARIGLTPSVK